MIIDIISAIFPRTCPICNKILKYGKGLICEECKRKLPYIKGYRCLKCGKPVEFQEVEFCYDCSRRKHIYDQGVGLFSYSDDIRNSIYRFKYNNKREYAKFYGKEIVKHMGDTINEWNADMIIPVPLHKTRLIERGYNQAELLGREISKKIGIPVEKNVLIRNKKTKPQKWLSDKERKDNTEKAFTIRKNIVKLKKVILIDDIYTTGSTMDGCAMELKDKGADKVYCVSLSIGKGF